MRGLAVPLCIRISVHACDALSRSPFHSSLCRPMDRGCDLSRRCVCSKTETPPRKTSPQVRTGGARGTYNNKQPMGARQAGWRYRVMLSGQLRISPGFGLRGHQQELDILRLGPPHGAARENTHLGRCGVARYPEGNGKAADLIRNGRSEAQSVVAMSTASKGMPKNSFHFKLNLTNFAMHRTCLHGRSSAQRELEARYESSTSTALESGFVIYLARLHMFVRSPQLGIGRLQPIGSLQPRVHTVRALKWLVAEHCARDVSCHSCCSQWLQLEARQQRSTACREPPCSLG